MPSDGILCLVRQGLENHKNRLDTAVLEAGLSSFTREELEDLVRLSRISLGSSLKMIEVRQEIAKELPPDEVVYHIPGLSASAGSAETCGFLGYGDQLFPGGKGC